MDKIEKILWKVKFEEKKNWLRAKELLLKGLEEYPSNKSLLFSLAMLFQSKKLYKKAIEYYQKILLQNPNDQKVNFKMINCLLFLKEYQVVIDYINDIKNPHPELLYDKAYAYSKLLNISASIEILESLQNNEMFAKISHLFLAELYYFEKDYEKALLSLDKAEKESGKNGSINYLRGLIFVGKKNYLTAYVEFSYADKLKISSPHFYRNYAKICDLIGNPLKAIDILMKCIKQHPFDVESYIEIIKLHLKLGKINYAFNISLQARKIFPYSISLSTLHSTFEKNGKSKND